MRSPFERPAPKVPAKKSSVKHLSQMSPSSARDEQIRVKEEERLVVEKLVVEAEQFARVEEELSVRMAEERRLTDELQSIERENRLRNAAEVMVQKTEDRRIRKDRHKTKPLLGAAFDEVLEKGERTSIQLTCLQRPLGGPWTPQ